MYLDIQKRSRCFPGGICHCRVGMDHEHIYGMTRQLLAAGATLKWAYDPDPEKLAAFCRAFETVRPARCEQEVLDDPQVRLGAAACVTSQRAALGMRVMRAGKDYFTDKAPLTTLSSSLR